jgi:nitroreductase
MNILELSQTRFSARKYTDEAVSDADLAYILECVRLAPSAVNRQPWKFVVVRSKEAKEHLWQAYDRDWFRTAPLYIVCMKNNSECWTRRYDDKQHGDIDVASYRASVPRRNGAQPRHLLGVQLRHRHRESPLPICRLRGCGYHPRRTHRRGLSACREEA